LVAAASKSASSRRPRHLATPDPPHTLGADQTSTSDCSKGHRPPKLDFATVPRRLLLTRIVVVVKAPISQIRQLCLGLPEAYEEETWGEATFRVRKKIFAMAGEHDGGGTVCMKTLREEQRALLAQGEPSFYPSYVGSKGWIGVDLRSKKVDWIEVGELLRESYRLIAPKGLSAGLD
jgi:predicted DNA-binding protein (MmcQ/YjbR family)